MPAKRFAAIGPLIPAVAAVACGRFGFEDRRGADPDATFDVMVVDTESSPTVTYVKPIAQRHPGAGSGDAFSIQADAAGDFIAMQVGCGDSNTAPTNILVTTSGSAWQFTKTGPLGGYNQVFAATYYAVAPDTQPTNVSVVWSTADCDIGKSVLADEFATPAGGSAYDGANQPGGNGNCQGGLVQNHDGNALWAACFSRGSVSGIGSSFLPGADNGGGDRAEYKLVTPGGVGSSEEADFPNASDFMLSMIAIRAK